MPSMDQPYRQQNRLYELFTAVKIASPTMYGNVSSRSCLLPSVIGILTISAIDFFNGAYSLAPLYLIVILFASWNSSRIGGYGVTVLAILGMLSSNYLAGMFSSPVQQWNSGVEVTVMLMTCTIGLAFRRHLDREGYLARFDSLTGVSNRTNFYELAQLVLSQSKRYNRAFTLAYIDLDNFKQVNDRQGHAAGDQVLVTVASAMRSTLREADIVARMGGDEFVILLAETDYTVARTVLDKLNGELTRAMEILGHPVTFSIGAISGRCSYETIDDLLSIADHLLYTIKLTDKNGICHRELSREVRLAAGLTPHPARRNVQGRGAYRLAAARHWGFTRR